MKKLTKDQRKGLIGTIIFHMLLIIALLFLALRTPLPLPGEEGVEVNFGYDQTGKGTIQKDNPPPKAKPVVPKKAKPTPPKPKPKPVEQKQKEDNLTQDIEKAPALEKKTKPKPKKPKVEKKVKTPPKKEEKPKTKDTVVSNTETAPLLQEKPKEKPKPVINQRALFKGSSKNKTGQSQGNTTGGGDQGKPHGYKDSNRYDGQGGQGNGVAFSLGGRGAKYLEKPTAKFTETGTVVVSIWVNPSGKVIRAQVNPKGTTVLDNSLRKIAVEAALNSTFAQDPTAPGQQRGTITYEFVLMK